MQAKHLPRFATLFILSSALASAGIFGFGKKENPLVADGYDVVSYRHESGPVEGNPKHSLVYDAMTYRFADESNLAAFQKDPAKYAPAYRGYCAYGVAKGGKYKVDPLAYSIVDDTLYLNYDQNVQKKWQAQQERYIREADRRWPDVK